MGTSSERELNNMDDFGNTGSENHSPVVLAIETSSRIGSVALASRDRVIEESTFSTPMQHSAEIFPSIEGLLARHGHTTENIDQVHIAIGPGSFTGLRIAVAMAKAMHLAQGVRIVTVDSLDIVAANLNDAAKEDPVEDRPIPFPERIAVLYDAKRGQFYASIYECVPACATVPLCAAEEDPGYEIPAPAGAFWRKIHPDSLMTTREILDSFARTSSLGVLGDGLLYHRDEFAQAGTTILPDRHWSPRAANVYRLGRQKASVGRFADPLSLTPFYLRTPHVTLKTRP